MSEIADGTAPEVEAEPEPLPEVAAAAEAEVETPEPVSESEVEPEPLPEETPEVVAEAEVQAPVSEPEPEPEPVAEVKVPTREELTGLYEEFRTTALPELEKQYQLDDETLTAYDENPKETLPKFAAQIHFNAMMSTYNAVLAAVPQVIQRVIEAGKVATAAEAQFYEKWPDLKGIDTNVLRTAAKSYRQANPTANLEQVITGAGTLAMVSAGLSLTPPAPPVPRKPPAKPAAPGGAITTPPVVRKPEDDNIFGQLSEDYDNSQFG